MATDLPPSYDEAMGDDTATVNPPPSAPSKTDLESSLAPILEQDPPKQETPTAGSSVQLAQQDFYEEMDQGGGGGVTFRWHFLCAGAFFSAKTFRHVRVLYIHSIFGLQSKYT